MSYPNNSYFFESRGNKKFYITIVDLAQWAYNITQRTEEGDEFHDAYSRFTSLFDTATTLFDGSLTYTDPQTLHNQAPSTIYYPKILTNPIGGTSKELINHYLEVFPYRLIVNPVEPGKFNPRIDVMRNMSYDDAMYATLDRLDRMIQRFVTFNKEKFLRLLALLNLKYNPIDNYDGTEKEEMGYSGEESMERTIHAGQLSGLKITGPSTDAAISTTSGETPVTTLSGNFNNSYKKNSAVAQVSDTKNGAIAGNATVEESSGTTTASTTTSGGTMPKSSHYTTTYDDASQNRLESYDTEDGTVAQSQKGTQSEDVPTMIEAYSGSPNSPSYTDTRNFDERKDERNLRKWGNMGTTTSQDMINQEREMVLEGWNIIGIFCEELNKEIFLSCYEF